MKGGLYAVTAKTLALDLLGKKFSGAIVTGFILFEPEKIDPHSIETFLIRVLKQSNPKTFVKCISLLPTRLPT